MNSKNPKLKIDKNANWPIGSYPANGYLTPDSSIGLSAYIYKEGEMETRKIKITGDGYTPDQIAAIDQATQAGELQAQAGYAVEKSIAILQRGKQYYAAYDQAGCNCDQKKTDKEETMDKKKIIINNQEELDKIERVESDEELIIDAPGLQLKRSIELIGNLTLRYDLYTDCLERRFFTTTGAPEIVTRGNSEPLIYARENSEPKIVAQDNSRPVIEAWNNSAPSIWARGTSAPRIWARGNSAPEIYARENSAPEIVAQDNSAPVIEAWNNSAPRIVARENSKPEIDAQGHSKPEIDAQGHSAPVIVARDNSAPVIDAKDNSAPVIEARENSAPVIVAWEHSEPRIEARENSAPVIVAWEHSAPEIDAQGHSKPKIVKLG